jgi:hypothetical protein
LKEKEGDMLAFTATVMIGEEDMVVGDAGRVDVSVTLGLDEREDKNVEDADIVLDGLGVMEGLAPFEIVAVGLLVGVGVVLIEEDVVGLRVGDWLKLSVEVALDEVVLEGEAPNESEGVGVEDREDERLDVPEGVTVGEGVGAAEPLILGLAPELSVEVGVADGVGDTVTGADGV